MKHPFPTLLILLVTFMVSCNSFQRRTDKRGLIISGLSSSNDSIRHSSYFLLLDSLNSGSYHWGDVKSFTTTMNKDADQLLVAAEKFQVKGNDHNWVWRNPDYLLIRERLSVLLHVLGHMYDRESLATCRRAVALEDNGLKMFGAIALLRQDQFVSEEVLEAIAADEETRLGLYTSLLQFKETNLFPEKFKTHINLPDEELEKGRARVQLSKTPL